MLLYPSNNLQKRLDTKRYLPRVDGGFFPKQIMLDFTASIKYFKSKWRKTTTGIFRWKQVREILRVRLALGDSRRGISVIRPVSPLLFLPTPIISIPWFLKQIRKTYSLQLTPVYFSAIQSERCEKNKTGSFRVLPQTAG